MNINAINDSIKAGFSILNKAVVSVMRGNAGAGGAMAAMASDLVWAHEHVILNPHYKVPGTRIPYGSAGSKYTPQLEPASRLYGAVYE